jgi:Ser/Thr protein kinase RdoA (MazF antagonist)
MMAAALLGEMMSTQVNTILARYELSPVSVTQLDTLWNSMFRVRSDTGKSYALRLYNPAVNDAELVRQEIQFVIHVAAQGDIQVPIPVLNRDGEYLTTSDSSAQTPIACMFEWIEGEDLRGRVSPEIARKIGRATAFLHRAARNYAFPVAGDGLRESYRWDENLVMEHHDWILNLEALIGTERSAVLHSVVDRVAAQLKDIPKSRETYGMNHADLHQGNLIEHTSEVAVIDFDQLGRGHFAYDLANIHTELTPEPAGKEVLWEALKEGYSAVLPLPVNSDAELEPFILAGELGFLDWYYNSPNPKIRERLGGRFEHALSALQKAL